MTDLTPARHHDNDGVPQHGYAYRPGDAPAYWNFGTYWQMLATSDATAGRSTTFDEDALAAQGYGLERLDQLVTELLLGVR